MRLITPIPPSINHCYYYKKGKKIKKRDARDFQQEVIWLTKEYISKTGKVFPEKTKIICNMWFYFPDNRRRDTHNLLKLLFDAIEDGGLYADDKWVLPRIMDFEKDKDNPRLEMEFKEV